MKCVIATGLLFLLMCGLGRSQTVPGTFNPVNTQSTALIAGPLLTPPSISFGSGLTAPTVVNGQTMMITAPQGTPAEPSAIQQRAYAGYANPVNGYVPMPTSVVIPVPAETSSTGMVPATTGTPRFDYIVAPNGSGSFTEASASGMGDTNLGQLAASLRKGPPPTQRTFTNDDIARMNGVSGNNYQMPGASTTQPQYPPQQAQPQPKPRSEVRGTPGAKPSPFSPRPAAQGTQQAASDQ